MNIILNWLAILEHSISYIPRWEASICFLVLLVMLVSALAIRTTRTWLKLTIAGISIATLILFALSISNSMGWPARQRLPQAFQVIWAEVIEPGYTKGEIRWWIRYLSKDGENVSSSSRVIALPYSIERHHLTAEIIDKIIHGEAVMLRQQDMQTGLKDGLPNSVDGLAGEDGSQGLQGYDDPTTGSLIPIEPPTPEEDKNKSAPRPRPPVSKYLPGRDS